MSVPNYISPAKLGYFKTKLYDIFAEKSIVDALIGTDSGKTVRAIAAEELAAQLIPENADAARDTLAEIAAWIQDHPDDAATMNANITALQQAVSSLQTSVNGLGTMASKNEVAEADLSAALKEKVNAAADGNHSHGNKTVLDGITAAKVSAWDGKAAGDHTHTPASIGAAAASHGHSYNDLSDKPTIPAAYSHPASHPASMISGLAAVATSGSYTDLADKPTIPAAYTHPATHAASMITGLATVATTGNYSDLSGKPTIPTTVAALTDSDDYAKKTDIPTFTEATDAQIDALFA